MGSISWIRWYSTIYISAILLECMFSDAISDVCSIEVVQLLIELKVDLNHANQQGLSPLLMAASRGHTNVGGTMIHAPDMCSQGVAYL